MSPLHGVDAHFDFVSPPATTGLAWITSPSFSIGLCAFAVTSDGKDVRSFASLPAIMQSLNDWTDVQCPLWVRSRHMQCKGRCPLHPRKRPRKRTPANSHVG